MEPTDQRPLAEVLFGQREGGTPRPEADLADAIQAWYRAWRCHVRDPATSSGPRWAPGDRRPPS